MESLDQILKIKFSSNGNQLLIVTSSRDLHLYVKGHTLHQWTNTHTSKWCEEEILFANFFHSKNRVSLLKISTSRQSIFLISISILHFTNNKVIFIIKFLLHLFFFILYCIIFIIQYFDKNNKIGSTNFENIL